MTAFPYRVVGADAEASYAAAVAAIAQRHDTTASVGLTMGAGANVWLDVDTCARAQALSVTLAATPRWEGPGVGAGADTAATLTFGPSVHEDPELGVLAWALTSWELTYQGDLTRRPQLADRADLARDVYDRMALGLATRGFRIQIADVCKPGDKRQDCVEGRGPTRPTPVKLDVASFEYGLGVTEQETRRLEERFAGAFLHVEMEELNGTAIAARMDLLRVETARSQIGDVTASIDTLWPVYLETTNPMTGTRYVIGYGFLINFDVHDGMRPRERDHTERALGGIGATGGTAARGTGLGWNRTAYLTMAAEPVLEDRITAEGWYTLDGYAVRGRAFAARLERVEPAAGQAATVWTSGLEVGGHHRWRGVDADLALEVGRSYYAALDGGAPTAGFGARAQLTLSRGGRTTWPSAPTTAPGAQGPTR